MMAASSKIQKNNKRGRGGTFFGTLEYRRKNISMIQFLPFGLSSACLFVYKTTSQTRKEMPLKRYKLSYVHRRQDSQKSFSFINWADS